LCFIFWSFNNHWDLVGRFPSLSSLLSDLIARKVGTPLYSG
jgi:hypothetical protein